MKIIKNRAQYMQIFRSKISTKEMFLLDFAYDLTKYAHGYLDQTRDAGERYFNHPRQVSAIIAFEFEVFDSETHLAALFHDVSEDTFLLNNDRIKYVFGAPVAKIVQAVTKQNFENKDKQEYLKSYFSKIAQVGWKACVIKCGDRLHNLRTLSDNTPKGVEKIKKQIIETTTYFPKLITKIEEHNKQLAEQVRNLIEKELKKLTKRVS